MSESPISLRDETGVERFRGTQSPGGGSLPGALRVLKYDFDYTMLSDLATGVPVWTPAIGDVLWDAVIVTPPVDLAGDTGAWDGDMEAKADIAPIVGGALAVLGGGFFAISAGPIDLGTDWNSPVNPPTVVVPSTYPQAYTPMMGAAAEAVSSSGANWEGGAPVLFLATTPLSLVVTSDGTLSGDEITGATQGASHLLLLVSTPAAAS